MGIARVRVGGLAVVGLLVVGPVVAAAATFSVDSTLDQVDATPGDGVCASAAGACTLRAAVLEANALPGPDAIALPAGTFRLAPSGGNEDAGLTGDLDVTDDLSVSGAGIDQTIIDGFGADRIFDFFGPGGLVLSGLTLRRGSAPGGDGGAIRHPGPGGLVLTSVKLERNHSGTGAGIHHADGELSVTGCTFADNVASYAGGGIYKAGAGALSVSGSVFTGNLGTGGPGGAIAFDGPDQVTIADSQFTSSLGGNGGAVSVNGSYGFAISNCQFSDSQSYGNGGAVSFTGPGGTTISGSSFTDGVAGGSGGGLFVDSQADLVVSGSTFRENAASYSGGGLYYNSGVGGLSLTDSTFTSNGAFGGPGGGFVANATGAVTLANVELGGNTSDDAGGGGAVGSPNGVSMSSLRVHDNVASANAGGGLYVNSGAAAPVFGSTFAGNRVDDGDGGGLELVGTGPYDVQGCTFSGNLIGGTDAQGAGLLLAAGEQSQILNVTFSGNASAYRGGGLFGGSEITVYSTTFSGNSASEGGAVYNGSLVRLGNTIVAGSVAGQNCAGNMFESGNRNIDSDGSCELDGPSDQTGIDPQLGPLADNGGPTMTHAIAPSSPAVDAGNPTACPATDQRGIARPADGNGDGDARCDIGAYEYVDQCPGDPKKVNPGPCGCGNPDPDDNGNGIADCLVNAEVKARIARARVLLAGLTGDKSRDRAIRAELKKLAAVLSTYVRQHRKGFILANPGANAGKLARKAVQAIKTALRARGGTLDTMRARAGGALDALDNALAAQ